MQVSGVARTRRRLVVAGVLLAAIVGAAWSQVPPPAEVAGDDVLVIAHSGAQAYAPTNTMPAFDLALEQGADVLEMDLQLTADGEVVILHDGTVDRTTDGTGSVGDLTLEEVKELDAGATFEAPDGTRPFAGQGVTIPTLAEVLDAYPDVPLNIELKTDTGDRVVQPAIDLVAASGRADTITISSFDTDYLLPVREQLPEVRTNMPEGETTGFYVRQLVGLHPWWSPPAEVFQVPEHHDGRRVVTPRFVRAAERVGATVEVWTVNDPEQMHRLLDAGVHGIMTDVPDVLVDVLEEREAARGTVRGPDPSRYAAQLDRAARLQHDLGWLTPLMAVVTFLGDEEFYLLAFPILFWAISRRWGIRLGVMLLVTAGLNGVLKLLFATPRPGFLAPELAQVDEHSFGIPSGHAQNAAAVWGLFAVGARRRAVRIGLVLLILAIGWSRVHLGAHLLEDLLVGWLVGAVLVVWFVVLEPRVVRWWRRVTDTERVLAGVVASLAMIAPATLLAGRLAGVSFGWVGLPDATSVAGASAAVTPAGTLAGLVVGLVLLARGGGFEVGGPTGQRVLRVLVGGIVVVVLWQGLGALLPGGEDPVALVLRYLRYAAVGAWVGGLGPLLFVRLGLASPGRRGASTDGMGQAAAAAPRP
ncbi:glycerophosphodiester phosphodiesterase family protein [Nitriliruptor alkaliphilus]|uniref:glycerophosphodiester phosphodiesterase family protein n=1 Tax=Nitriliruptor alkaliphilus TaxID=427918 RepID=UPI000697F246|nr:glycerophosphodiester phosphodiesterase family protein [Nitriliruptor alkaliphilus]